MKPEEAFEVRKACVGLLPCSQSQAAFLGQPSTSPPPSYQPSYLLAPYSLPCTHTNATPPAGCHEVAAPFSWTAYRLISICLVETRYHTRRWSVHRHSAGAIHGPIESKDHSRGSMTAKRTICKAFPLCCTPSWAHIGVLHADEQRLFSSPVQEHYNTAPHGP